MKSIQIYGVYIAIYKYMYIVIFEKHTDFKYFNFLHVDADALT